MKSIELRAKRAALIDEIKKLNAEAKGTFDADQKAKWNAMMAEARDLLERAEAMEAIEEEEKRNAQPEGGKPDDLRQKKDKGIEYKDALNAYMRYGYKSLNQETRDALDQGFRAADVPKEYRNQVVGTDASGGYAVHDEQTTEIIRVLKQYSAMLDVCRIIPTATGGRMTMLKKDLTARKGAIITELTDDSIVTQTFGQFVLDAFTYTSQGMRWSMELIQDDGFNLISEVSNDGMEIIGRRLEEDFTTGDHSSKPNGVTNAAADSGVTIASATITRAKLEELVYSVDRAYRANGRLMFSDATMLEIVALDIGSNDSRPLFKAGTAAGEPDRICGVPFTINNEMPNIVTSANKCILFGDFSKYIIRQVRDFTLLRDEIVGKRAVDFYMFGRFDGDLQDSSALKYLAVA